MQPLVAPIYSDFALLAADENSLHLPGGLNCAKVVDIDRAAETACGLLGQVHMAVLLQPRNVLP